MSERMIEQFMEMVKIDSESGNEERMINYLQQEFIKIGATAEIDSYGNLIAKLKDVKIKKRFYYPVTLIQLSRE